MHRIMLAGVAVAVALAFLGGAAFATTKAPGPLGLPSVETLKEKLALTEVQTKSVEGIYDEFKDKAKEIEEKGAATKKAAMRSEIVSRIKAVCTDDQKKMLDEIVSEKEKK